jgi:hypothetical protein
MDTFYHNSWLCKVCHKIETAWSAEDFQYEEDDPDDLKARTFFNGEKKATASRKYRNKKQGKKAKPLKVETNNNLPSMPVAMQCRVEIKRLSPEKHFLMPCSVVIERLSPEKHILMPCSVVIERLPPEKIF